MVGHLLTKLKEYNPIVDEVLVTQAYNRLNDLYENEYRLNNDPVSAHALRVTEHVMNSRVDATTVTAALLHDALRDGKMSYRTLVQEFGEEVASLVKGVTRLKSIKTKTGSREYRENFRNLFLAAGKDIRVVLIRLAEKLHNLETVEAIKEIDIEFSEKSIQKAFDIYAPLAEQLNLIYFKRNLEDLAFKHTYPEVYREIKEYFQETKNEREEYVDRLAKLIQDELKTSKLDVKVFGRAKHFYSIFRKYHVDYKRRAENDPIEKYLDRLQDKLAFTVLCDEIEACYHALDIIHQRWPHDHQEFDDYIASPKPNGYKSIQTTIFEGKGESDRVEIQIRTHEMHEYNEYGPASHYFYKEYGRGKGGLVIPPAEKIEMLKSLLQWHEKSLASGRNENALEMDLFDKRVFVFTPKGDLKDLRKGSTPIDFAYSIHTDIGHAMIGAKVNGKMVALDYKLQNEDVCEILTTSRPKLPNPDWLYIAESPDARAKIRRALRDKKRW